MVDTRYVMPENLSKGLHERHDCSELIDDAYPESFPACQQDCVPGDHRDKGLGLLMKKAEALREHAFGQAVPVPVCLTKSASAGRKRLRY